MSLLITGVPPFSSSNDVVAVNPAFTNFEVAYLLGYGVIVISEMPRILLDPFSFYGTPPTVRKDLICTWSGILP